MSLHSFLASLSEAPILADPWRLAATGLGPFIGSFAALVSVRLPMGEPILLGRSRCRNCHKTLSPVELVPIASWLFQRARCRKCCAAISVRYPAIELGFLAVGLASAVFFPGPLALAGAIFGWQLVLLALLDAEHFWLPDGLTLTLGLSGLGAALILVPAEFPDRAIGAIAGFLSLFLIAMLYKRLRGREGMGGGDPKLLAGLGAWLGWRELPAVLLLAAVLGLGLVFFQRLRGRAIDPARPLPFGTFLAAAGFMLFLLWPVMP